MASRTPQLLQIDHDDSVIVSSSEDEDDDLSDDEIAACSEPFSLPAPLTQPDSLPGIESGQHLLYSLPSRRLHYACLSVCLSVSSIPVPNSE